MDRPQGDRAPGRFLTERDDRPPPGGPRVPFPEGSMEDLHPLLDRQLRDVGWLDPQSEPSLDQLHELLERVELEYARADQDRVELKRSLAVSSHQTREMHDELLEEHSRVRIVLEALTAAVLYLDGDGCIRFVNPGAEELLGTSRERLKGRRLDEALELTDSGGDRWDPADVKSGEVLYRTRDDGTHASRLRLI